MRTNPAKKPAQTSDGLDITSWNRRTILACGYEKRSIARSEKIVEEIQRLLKKKDLPRKALDHAGPNREPLDPVSYISNRSSGKMGYALARAGVRRGAEVSAGQRSNGDRAAGGGTAIAVTDSGDMRAAILKEYGQCTAVIWCGVSDTMPLQLPRRNKARQGPIELRLERHPDILKELGQNKAANGLSALRGKQKIDVLTPKKLREKNLDMVVATNVAERGAVSTAIRTSHDR